MKNLLDRSLKPLIIYSLIVLALSIPVYFLIIDWLWLRELDKHHYAIRKKLEDRISTLQIPDTTTRNMLSILNHVQPGFYFTEKVSDYQSDSLYTVIRFDEFMQDREQFRCLKTAIQINDRRYGLLIETNMEEIDETILAIATITFLFFFLLLGGFIYLNRKTSRRIWQPFYTSLSKINAFNLNSERHVQFEPTNIREFDELHQSLQTLIDHSISTFQLQKEFTQNASHELQTPLAIVKSKLDILAQSNTIKGKELMILEDAYLAINRVTRINKNLLLLAKIDTPQFDETDEIDPAALALFLINQFKDFYPDKLVTIIDKRTTVQTCKANPTLVEILFTNLLINAVKYSPASSDIAWLQTDHLISISNDGAHALDQNSLFKRFHSSGGDPSGSGLGLAIAKEICDRYGWKLWYKFREGQHHFSIDC